MCVIASTLAQKASFVLVNAGLCVMFYTNGTADKHECNDAME